MADQAPPDDASLITRAARYFARRREFLGYWLDLYCEAEDLSPVALARLLRCEVEVLPQLSLCLRPRDEQLFEDTGELASRYGLDQDALTDLLHQAEVYERRGAARATLQGRPALVVAEGAPVFSAAQDREEPGTPEERRATEDGADGGSEEQDGD
jgi:hypothetical protein